jgi:hypothetical protein
MSSGTCGLADSRRIGAGAVCDGRSCGIAKAQPTLEEEIELRMLIHEAYQAEDATACA